MFEFIYLANAFGIFGSKLVLETDGTEICDNSVLEYYLKNNTVLMVTSDDQFKTNTKMNDGAVVSEIIVIPPVDNEFAPTSSTNNTIPSQITNNDVLYLDVSDAEMKKLTGHSSAIQRSNPVINTENMFTNFQIPWKKVPIDILKILDSHQKLGKRLNVFANLIVDELRDISPNISMAVFRNISQQAIRSYPDSFLEKDNQGEIISQSNITLLTTMRNRNNFLNRAPKRNNENDPDVPVKCRRRTQLFKNTCTNWQPSNINQPDAASSLQFKKTELQKCYGNFLNAETKLIVKKYMADCYGVQRLFFNNMNPVPSISSIKSEWPYIFDKEYLVDHFRTLMNIEPSTFVSNFRSSEEKLIRFFQNLKKQKILDAVKDQTNGFAILAAVSTYFNEDTSMLFKKFQVRHFFVSNSHIWKC